MTFVEDYYIFPLLFIANHDFTSDLKKKKRKKRSNLAT